jgi:DNA-binding MarR family transcriptional regulator
VNLSVASRQVAALVLAGYVLRGADPQDGRAQILHPTDAGTQVLTDSHRRMVSTATTALAGWSDAEIAGLAAQLERLRADFAAVAARPERTAA